MNRSSRRGFVSGIRSRSPEGVRALFVSPRKGVHKSFLNLFSQISHISWVVPRVAHVTHKNGSVVHTFSTLCAHLNSFRAPTKRHEWRVRRGLRRPCR